MNMSIDKGIAQWRKCMFQPKIIGPFMGSFNMTADLLGKPDTRPGTWGKAESLDGYITFRPPDGYRVRILRVSGDFIAFPKVLPGAAVSIRQPGAFAGALLALANTGPGGSIRADYLADACFLYVQLGLNWMPKRAEYDRDVSIGGLLLPDNKLKITLAVFL